MEHFGFQILQALITDLDPDQRVKNAMNEINSSKVSEMAGRNQLNPFHFNPRANLIFARPPTQRLKFAVAEQAEGAKILQVKAAEAEAESKYLSGVGVAKQVRGSYRTLALSHAATSSPSHAPAC